jgi:hypothetical protein
MESKKEGVKNKIESNRWKSIKNDQLNFNLRDQPK